MENYSEVLDVRHLVCNQCQNQLDPYDRFCATCGAEASNTPGVTGPEGAVANPPTKHIEYVRLPRRWLARVLDSIIITLCGLIIAVPLFYLLQRFSLKTRFSLIYLILFTVVIVYKVYFITQKGGTPGKLLLNIRIVNQSNSYISVPQALLRLIPDLLNYVFLLTEEIGLFTSNGVTIMLCVVTLADAIAVMYNDKQRMLHDLIADTYVISERVNSPSHA